MAIKTYDELKQHVDALGDYRQGGDWDECVVYITANLAQKISRDWETTNRGLADIELLALALNKFAPDLAEQLISRWQEPQSALSDFLRYLRKTQ